jgi:hypothetical protein
LPSLHWTVSLPGNAGHEPSTTDHRSRRTPLNFFAAAGFFTAIISAEVFLRLVRRRRGNDHEPRVFLAGQQHRRAMTRFQFPVNEDHPALGEAADIAMDYLTATGLATRFANPESLVSATVLAHWHRGVRHRIALANAAIVAAEKLAAHGHLPPAVFRGLM